MYVFKNIIIYIYIYIPNFSVNLFVDSLAFSLPPTHAHLPSVPSKRAWTDPVKSHPWTDAVDVSVMRTLQRTRKKKNIIYIYI